MALRTLSVGIDGSEPATSACLGGGSGRARRRLVAGSTGLADAASVCLSCGPLGRGGRRLRPLGRVDTLEAAGITTNVESVVVRGAAGPSLVDGSSDTDLLVVGRSGADLVDYKPLFGELLGASAARYCAHHATIPVAAVNEGATWVDSPQVVVGIDGSPASLKALRWATEQLPVDATIHAVRAVSLPDAERRTPVDHELLDPSVAEHRAELQRAVDANIDASFRAAGRSVQVHVVLGYAQDGIIDPGFAYDLIVVGAHAKTAVPPGVLGSVADYTLAQTTVPIVIVAT